MWKPVQRIRWKTEPGGWPNEAQAKAAMLFEPMRVGPLHLDSRVWVPAMVPWRAALDGSVTSANIDWYRRFAQGAPGVIVVEATGIRDVPSGALLRISDDKFVQGLGEIARVIHEASGGRTRAIIQLIDFLAMKRRPDPKDFFFRYLAITERHREKLNLPGTDDLQVRTALSKLTEDQLMRVLEAREFENLKMGFRERVTDVHLQHIRELPEQLPSLFAQAAKRAQDAGFDGVELHYAHAYTMASFLSTLNTRQDKWGGSREDRVRLPLDVFRAVRACVEPSFAVGCRLLTEEIIAGGAGQEDAEFYALELSRAGMDFLSFSRGGKFEDAQQPKVKHAAYPYTGPSGYECMPQYISDEQGPFGRNVAPTKRIRQRLRAENLQVPVVVAGGIYDFSVAEELLRNGSADLIGMARQSLADPDWSEKVRMGRGEQVRLCRYSNYCEALDARHEMVTCELWDRENLHLPGVAKTPDGRRRLVPESEACNKSEDNGKHLMK
jgi:2,4-dienoyl-CoA reductase-like NADH-dependent reductase (Old Yellow Enzyme family)